jgi:dTDP-4-dehydrorhamnose 3,5-epimerase
MKAISTAIPGVFLFEPTVFEDPRGCFFESYREDVLQACGIQTRFVQENQSKSKRGVLRGLHYQLRNPQGKLCRVVSGAVLDVAVDVRLGSPTFGQHVKAVLSAVNRLQLFVPRGFAHGMLALTDEAEFVYKCDDVYHGDDCCGIAWDDPTLGIDWGIEYPLLSRADSNLPSLARITTDHLPVMSFGGELR